MPSSSAYIPSFSISNFAQSVSAPYTSFGAYASGVIDANGNLLKPESSIDPFEYFVIKLKKIFEELPTNYTKARLNSYMSAFQIFNEEAEFLGIPKEHFLLFVEGYLEGGLLLNEDMGAGMATGGTPGSLGTAQVVPNTGTVMGYDKPMDLPLFRRSPVEMFDVDHNEFQNFKNAKAWKHIPDSPTKKYLKRFQQRNPNGKMAIRTKKPDTDEHDLYWITYPAKNFMEEYNLEHVLEILNEKAQHKEEHDNQVDVNNPDHVHELINSSFTTLQNDLQANPRFHPSTSKEHANRLALMINGLHAAHQDSSGKNKDAELNFFKEIFKLKNKRVSDADTKSKKILDETGERHGGDAVAYDSQTGQARPIDVKHRYTARERLQTPTEVSNVPELQSAFQKDSKIGTTNPLWKLFGNTVLGNILDTLGQKAEDKIYKGQGLAISAQPRAQGQQQETSFVAPKGFKNIKEMIAHRGLGGIRPQSDGKVIQPEIKELATQTTLNRTLSDFADPNHVHKLYVTKADMEHLRKRMTHSDPHMQKTADTHMQNLEQLLKQHGLYREDFTHPSHTARYDLTPPSR